MTEAAGSRREVEEEERRTAYDRWRAERLGSDRSIGFESLIAREVNTLVVETNDLPSYEVSRAAVPVAPT